MHLFILCATLSHEIFIPRHIIIPRILIECIKSNYRISLPYNVITLATLLTASYQRAEKHPWL